MLTVAALEIRGDEHSANLSVQASNPTAVSSPTPCTSLLPGHRRRIFFGLVDTSDPTGFGLGYEELDEHGKLASPPAQITSFDPNVNMICLPLGAGEVHETWELVNLATETHNFHIHQARFKLIPGDQAKDLDSQADGGPTEDNVPLPFPVPLSLMWRTIRTAIAPLISGATGNAPRHQSSSTSRSRNLASSSSIAISLSTRTGE